MECRKTIYHKSAEQQAIAAKLNHASRQPALPNVPNREEKYWLFIKKIQDLQKVFLITVFVVK
jgi:hypothetical protein